MVTTINVQRLPPPRRTTKILRNAQCLGTNASERNTPPVSSALKPGEKEAGQPYVQFLV